MSETLVGLIAVVAIVAVAAVVILKRIDDAAAAILDAIEAVSATRRQPIPPSPAQVKALAADVYNAAFMQEVEALPASTPGMHRYRHVPTGLEAEGTSRLSALLALDTELGARR